VLPGDKAHGSLAKMGMYDTLLGWMDGGGVGCEM
jgi:hypothetical protein